MYKNNILSCQLLKNISKYFKFGAKMKIYSDVISKYFNRLRL